MPRDRSGVLHRPLSPPKMIVIISVRKEEEERRGLCRLVRWRVAESPSCNDRVVADLSMSTVRIRWSRPRPSGDVTRDAEMTPWEPSTAHFHSPHGCPLLLKTCACTVKGVVSCSRGSWSDAEEVKTALKIFLRILSFGF